MKGFGIIKPLEQVGWIEKDAPVAGPYEAVLEPVALIPCTSDVDTAAENPNAPVGRILGHEGVGRIVSVKGTGISQSAIIEFDGYGKMNIALAYAPISKE